VRDGRGRGRSAIGIIAGLNNAVGGVKVGDSALIRALEGYRALLHNGSLL
jgi:hypothetical protein